MQKIAQQVQGLVLTVDDGVAIGDDQGIPLGPVPITGHAPASPMGCAFGPEGLFNPDGQVPGIMIRVNLPDQRQQPGAESSIEFAHKSPRVSQAFQTPPRKAIPRRDRTGPHGFTRV